MTPAARRIAARSLKLLAAALFAFALGEGGLRLFAFVNARWLLSPRIERLLAGRTGASVDVGGLERSVPKRLFGNTPNYRTSRIRINSRGFRGPEFAQEKVPGARRVICAGDSCTFGWQLPDADAYPRRLEEELNRRGGAPAEVINAGVPGYSSWQVRSWCEDELWALGPDAMVFYVGWNDVFEARPEVGAESGEDGKRLAYLLRRSVLVTELRFAYYRLQRALEQPAALKRGLFLNFRPNFFLSQMERAVEGSRRRGARVLLATLPSPYRAEGAGAASVSDEALRFDLLRARYNDAIRSLARERGAGLADLAAAMDGKPELFSDFCHPNAEGNRLIARILAEALAA